MVLVQKSSGKTTAISDSYYIPTAALEGEFPSTGAWLVPLQRLPVFSFLGFVKPWTEWNWYEKWTNLTVCVEIQVAPGTSEDELGLQRGHVPLP